MNVNWLAKFRRAIRAALADPFHRRQMAELAFVLVVAVLLNIFGRCVYWTLSWRELPREGMVRKWQRGHVTHINENGDGRVDEEIVEDPVTHRRTVRRDANHDGWFDLKYEHGRYGIVMKVQQIHERAPRH